MAVEMVRLEIYFRGGVNRTCRKIECGLLVQPGILLIPLKHGGILILSDYH